MINWREIPFMRILLPFIAGIASSIFIDAHHWIFFLITGLLIIFLSFFRYFKINRFKYPWTFGIASNLLIFLIGFQWCYQHNETRWSNHFESHIKEENFVIGKVTNTPGGDDYLSTRFEILQIGTHPDSLKTCQGNLLVYIKKSDTSAKISYGDVMAFKGKLQKSTSPNNPNAFDIGRYLHYQNIHYQGFLYDSTSWQIVESGQGNFILKNTIALREYFLKILKKHIPSENELAVANALILGHKDELNTEVRTAYSHTGALHVLAVSGLHVGLVTFFINFFLNLVYKSKKLGWIILKMFIVIGFTWGFALITGGSPSVLRAATMFSFLTFGLTINRPTNIYNSIAISIVLLLIYDPYLLMHVGFQLSYSAVIGIIFFQPKFYKSLVVKNKILDYAWSLVTVSFAAQLSTLPISIYYFHLFPIYFWLSGIVVIPAAVIILGSGILLLATHAITPIASIIGTILYYSIWGMNQLVFFIQQLPFSVWLGIWVGIPIVLLLYLIISSVAMMYIQKKQRWLLLSAAMLVIISINYSFTFHKNFKQKKIFIYHVGQNTIIDIFDGKEGYSLSNNEIPKKKITFATQNNRWAHGVKNIQSYSTTDTTIIENNFLFQSSFIQFYNKKIALVDDSFFTKPVHQSSGGKEKRIEVDYLLICGNPKFKISNLLQSYHPKLIVIDASNSKWKTKKWKEECKELDVPFYDITSNGALEINQ